jgi:hypothetical protein
MQRLHVSVARCLSALDGVMHISCNAIDYEIKPEVAMLG